MTILELTKANISTKKRMSYLADDRISVKADSFFENEKNYRILMKVMNELKCTTIL
jgi:hypothetical protein